MYTVKNIIDNNRKEGYSTALINHARKQVFVNAEMHELGEEPKFKNDIFNVMSVDGNFETLMHNISNIKNILHNDYPDYEII